MKHYISEFHLVCQVQLNPLGRTKAGGPEMEHALDDGGSNLQALASNLLAISFKFKSNGLQASSDGLQHTSFPRMYLLCQGFLSWPTKPPRSIDLPPSIERRVTFEVAGPVDRAT